MKSSKLRSIKCSLTLQRIIQKFSTTGITKCYRLSSTLYRKLNQSDSSDNHANTNVPVFHMVTKLEFNFFFTLYKHFHHSNRSHI